MKNISQIVPNCQLLSSFNDVSLAEILNISSHTTNSVISIFLYMSNRYQKNLHPSQLLLAKQLFKCRKTINRQLKMLHEKGIILKKKRYNTTSLYTLSPTFFNYAHILKDKFPALKHVLNATLLSTLLPASAATFQKNVPSSSSSIIIYNNILLTRDRKIDKETRFIKKSKKRKRMEEFIMTPSLKELTKELNLSKAGQIKLCAFSEVIREQVLKSYKNLKTKPNKPYEWIFVACTTLSESHGIEIDWPSYYHLKSKYNIRDNAPMTLPRNTLNSSLNGPDNYLARRPKDIAKSQERRQSIQSDPEKSALQKEYEKIINPIL